MDQIVGLTRLLKEAEADRAQLNGQTGPEYIFRSYLEASRNQP